MAKIRITETKPSSAVGAPTVAPYGSWRSAISSDLISQQSIGLSEVRLDGDDIYWLEDRPQENGRSVVVRAGGAPEGLNPKQFSARNEVHSYGGGAWIVDNGSLYFSNLSDGRLYRQDRNTTQPRPITPAPASAERNWRYADGIIDRHRNRWIGVREDHTNSAQDYPVNTIVAVDLNGSDSSPGTILASGHDFFSSARLSPDGSRLAWLAWDQPNMPWTSTTLHMVAFDRTGVPTGEPIAIADDRETSLLQPEWAPDGSALCYCSDGNGWWNLCGFDLARNVSRCILPIEAEFGRPQWHFGMSTYAFAQSGEVVAAYVKDGLTSLARLNLATGRFSRLDLPFTEIFSVRADANGRVVFCGGAPNIPMSVVRLDLNSGVHLILKQATDLANDQSVKRLFSTVVPVTFPTTGRRKAHALYYPPSNPDFVAPKRDLAPLVVRCHGGPTAAASSALDLKIHYWTSRGIAVIDVNYGGSTGYGRSYRNRLHRRWGIVDVADCVSAAKYLAAARGIDRKRSVIAGGSAGGYTTLATLTFRKHFAGGASYYGVSDMSALAKGTHKFEARYLDWLVGPYPKDKKIYRARSPVFHPDRISKPVIFFQGDQDPIVPADQTEKMVAALRRRKVSTCYLLFAGEKHGFRMAQNIKRALDAELYFYATEVFHTKLVF